MGLVPFSKGSGKKAKPFVSPSNPMPDYLSTPEASPSSNMSGEVIGNKIPKDLNLPWEKVPFPSDNS